tara:strand:+ start:897 stop:1634 length:738 start_codon:yes stop_codon:yes gene_type:complete
MGFIGVQPASIPLTADDVPDLPATKITSGTFPALNGSNLTNLDAADLTGTLPAINGANLTGIDASKLIFLKALTPSSASSASFNNGDGTMVMDGTYNHYLFSWRLQNGTNNNHLEFQFSSDSGSSYGVNISTSSSAWYEKTDGSSNAKSQASGTDTASGSASHQKMSWVAATHNNYDIVGQMHLWNPSSTYPYYSAECIYTSNGSHVVRTVTHGWCNVTSVTGWQLAPSSGNFSGEAYAYAFSKS